MMIQLSCFLLDIGGRSVLVITLISYDFELAVSSRREPYNVLGTHLHANYEDFVTSAHHLYLSISCNRRSIGAWRPTRIGLSVSC